MPAEEGTKIPFYEIGVEGWPICIGNGAQCLKASTRVWLSIANINTVKKREKKELFLLQRKKIKGIDVNGMFPQPDLPPCQNTNLSYLSDMVHWKVCRGGTAQVLVNTSSESIIDWSPYGSAQMVEGKELRWKWNSSDEIYTTTKCQ